MWLPAAPEAGALTRRYRPQRRHARLADAGHLGVCLGPRPRADRDQLDPRDQRPAILARDLLGDLSPYWRGSSLESSHRRLSDISRARWTAALSTYPSGPRQGSSLIRSSSSASRSQPMARARTYALKSQHPSRRCRRDHFAPIHGYDFPPAYADWNKSTSSSRRRKAVEDLLGQFLGICTRPAALWHEITILGPSSARILRHFRRAIASYKGRAPIT